MAGDKFLKLGTGGAIEEDTALQTSVGAGDAGAIPALDSTGRIDTTMMPVGIGADIANIVSSENLSAGDFVNVWDDAGTVKVRKADATAAGKLADGFVLDAVTAPAAVGVYFEGTNTQVSGKTLGAVMFLQTTAGAAADTVPSTSGNVVQKVGKAISATAISFEPSLPVTLA